MQFCLPHWVRLKDEIRECGLFHLVATSGEAAAARLMEEANHSAKIATYDPLMDAHNMIIGRAVECGGLEFLQSNLCPLCEANEHTHEGMSDEWIITCVATILAYCEDNGLRSINSGGT